MALRPGTYKAQCTAIAEGTSRNGVPQVELTFRIVEGPDTGSTIRAWLYFSTEANSKISFDNLRNCGWNDVLDGSWTGIGSKIVELVLDNEVYEGKERLKVKFINDPANPRGSAQALDESGKKAFLGVLAQMHGSSVMPPRTEGADQQFANADNIPF
jgi:hypothetical protein